ncbi:MAG TPA: hypothetical protein VHL58_02080 [Thermoanaerobaculia bacterium]|nr:hypothetical protein [Thermoanaerobaculia bacterium]
MKIAAILLLPLLGTQFKPLPPGPGRALAETACFACHSADILVQQRLTEKQWTATVEKMMRWGAEVKESDKPLLIKFLATHFGPENRFTPTKTKPVR